MGSFATNLLPFKNRDIKLHFPLLYCMLRSLKMVADHSRTFLCGGYSLLEFSRRYTSRRYTHIASVEVFLVLATLLALSDNRFLVRVMIRHCKGCPMYSPYQRPLISRFYGRVEQPSDSCWVSGVIETLVYFLVAVFAPSKESPAMPAIFQFFDSLQPGIDGS